MPTYSLEEVKSMLPQLDLQSVGVLLQVIDEEQEAYNLKDYREVLRIVRIREAELKR